jgi:hypothetical protein
MGGCLDELSETMAKGNLLIMSVTQVGLSLTHYKVASDDYLDAAQFLLLYQALVCLYIMLYVGMLLWVLLQCTGPRANSASQHRVCSSQLDLLKRLGEVFLFYQS